MATKLAKPNGKKVETKRKPMAVVVPGLPMVTRWYTRLLEAGTFQSRGDCQAFFYEACWAEDAALERAWEAWCAKCGNEDNLPLDAFEEKLVEEARFAELHAFLKSLTPKLLARALPLMRAFVKHPERYEAVGE